MNAHEKQCVHVLGAPPQEFRVDGKSDGRPGVDKQWSEMSHDEQRFATLLGWNDVKWYRRDRVPQTQQWTDLSLEKQNAAVFLVRIRLCDAWICCAAQPLTTLSVVRVAPKGVHASRLWPEARL